MKPVEALAEALARTLDPESDTPRSGWEAIARKVVQELQGHTDYDVVEAEYCLSCPVRQRVERSMDSSPRDWLLGK